MRNKCWSECDDTVKQRANEVQGKDEKLGACTSSSEWSCNSDVDNWDRNREKGQFANCNGARILLWIFSFIPHQTQLPVIFPSNPEDFAHNFHACLIWNWTLQNRNCPFTNISKSNFFTISDTKQDMLIYDDVIKPVSPNPPSSFHWSTK